MKAVSLLFLRFVDGHGVQDSVVGNVHGGEAADVGEQHRDIAALGILRVDGVLRSGRGVGG